MDRGAGHKATAEEKAWPTCSSSPYTGCPVFVLIESRAGGKMKEWCSQGQKGRGVNHDGGHH
jgi:hypothetical protein